MLATVENPLPNSLLLHSKDLAALQQRSRLLLAMKFFELCELTSGQAAEMCGLSRVACPGCADIAPRAAEIHLR